MDGTYLWDEYPAVRSIGSFQWSPASGGFHFPAETRRVFPVGVLPVDHLLNPPVEPSALWRPVSTPATGRENVYSRMGGELPRCLAAMYLFVPSSLPSDGDDGTELLRFGWPQPASAQQAAAATRWRYEYSKTKRNRERAHGARTGMVWILILILTPAPAPACCTACNYVVVTYRDAVTPGATCNSIVEASFHPIPVYLLRPRLANKAIPVNHTRQQQQQPGATTTTDLSTVSFVNAAQQFQDWMYTLNGS
ncbi:hypothetical protein EDB80DRAFT_685175 [Ilyonectria destructans]|nr:hypothetical protein EDB80DRAFT_685175 [Ilyonectria destructans]